MNFHVLTLFPEMIESAINVSITGRAIEKGLISVNTVNIRDFANNKHNRVDDYPYGGGEDILFLPFDKRKTVLDDLLRMKKKGLPVANSYACLEAMKDNGWKCHSWMIASVGPEGKITEGCYVKDKGEVACGRCGFSAHTEISLAYSGVMQAIMTGNRLLGPERGGCSCRKPI